MAHDDSTLLAGIIRMPSHGQQQDQDIRDKIFFIQMHFFKEISEHLIENLLMSDPGAVILSCVALVSDFASAKHKKERRVPILDPRDEKKTIKIKC